MNDGNLLLRMAQPIEQFPHPIEFQHFLAAGHRLHPFVVDPIQQEPQGGFMPRRRESGEGEGNMENVIVKRVS